MHVSLPGMQTNGSSLGLLRRVARVVAVIDRS